MHAGDCNQPLASFVLASGLLDDRIRLLDPYGQLIQLQLQLCQQQSRMVPCCKDLLHALCCALLLKPAVSKWALSKLNR
jgi:hypothetical protein